MAQVTGLPVQEQERIQDIDILRGFAILGILLVNMMFFAYPFEKSFISYATLSVTDKIAAGFIQIFATAKFYTLFSLLFGVGLAVQISRTDARAINLRPLYRRRLLVLLLIGLVHGLLIWYGDILMTYALTGFLLSLFRRRKQKTVLIWAASLLTLMMLLPVARYIYVKNTTHSAAEALEKKQERREKIRQAGSDATKNYRYGTLRDIQEQRTKDFAKANAFTPFFLPHLLALFLIGLYAGRRGVLQNIPDNLPWIRRVRNWGLLIGLIGNTVWSISAFRTSGGDAGGFATIGHVCNLFGAPALTFFYAASLLLVLQDPRWRARLAYIANVGRMALSNYLLQSVVCTTIFYSYGLALYGRIGPALGVLLTLAIFGAQIPLSTWWLSRFLFGPVEWFWRSLTYLKAQPLRRPAPPLPSA